MEMIRKLIDRITRPSRKICDFFPLAILISLIVTVAGIILSQLINRIGAGKLIEWICQREDVASFMYEYFGFIGIWISTLFVVLLFRSNRKMLKSFVYNRRGNSFKGFLIGLLLGFGTNGFCILMSVLMNDIKLSFFGIDPLLIISFFISVLIQSGAEELIDRFYLYQKLRRRYRNPLVAILINSIVFTLLHVANPGFTFIAAIQIFLFGIIASMLVYWYDGLWIAMAFHTAWNFSQSIVFGLPNSGAVSAYSIFNLEAASATNGFFYNVNFGVEGSIGAVLVLLIVGIVIFIINKNRPERNDLWAQEDTRTEQ